MTVWIDNTRVGLAFTMTAGLTALVLLSAPSLIQALEPVSLVSVEVGLNVTFACSRTENTGDIFYWFKIKVGYVIETIVEGYFGELILRSHFQNGRFTSWHTGDVYFLNIANVNKEDEATYTCQAGTSYSMRFIGSTHLLVKGPMHESFNVKQIPQAMSVEAGQSVTLQCSILSESKENNSLCPGECSVYWFKSGSQDSSSHIIYTEADDEKAQGSCVYHLFKLIQNSSDSGTYHCAVATCGQILFGQGTHVEIRMYFKLEISTQCHRLQHLKEHLGNKWFSQK
ncbi:contactin-3-like isoform X1 [Syngnathus scovelli]|uniref:contactin-3-like isoform X1 n=1 Tax=Syngnathus scovelli TaxID=161590 RepID=UPI0021101F22|nr:obscurin-like isoform X1 [Syngnathus scovelli]